MHYGGLVHLKPLERCFMQIIETKMEDGRRVEEKSKHYWMFCILCVCILENHSIKQKHNPSDCHIIRNSIETTWKSCIRNEEDPLLNDAKELLIYYVSALSMHFSFCISLYRSPPCFPLKCTHAWIKSSLFCRRQLLLFTVPNVNHIILTDDIHHPQDSARLLTS